MSGESWPLTEAQEGIWYAQAQAPGRATFNTGQVLWIDGALDLPALERAVAHLCEEAESLRLRFGLRAGQPVQWLGEAPALRRRDLSGASRSEAEAAIREDAFTRMDLAAGPVADLTLWRLDDTRHALSQRIHHLAADGYANTLITRRIAALYAHYAEGAPAPRPLAPWQAARDADAAYRAAPGRAGDRDWWHAQLDGLGTVGSLAPGRAAASERFLRAEHPSDPGLPAALRALAERAGISWADALTALTAAYCARLTEGESVPGIPLMNRMGGGVGSVPSTQVNVLPFRHPVDEAAPLAEWLAGAAATLGEMRRHGRYRGEHLRRELGLVGGARRLHGPLINVLPFEPTPRMPGLETRLEILGAGSVDDITFAFRGDGRGPLRLQVDANPALYSRDDAEAHLHRLTVFLTRACDAGRLADLPTLTEAETRSHVTPRNATAHPVPETTLSALIEAQMAASPEATALHFEGETTDYATLDRRSAALAARLRALGAGRARGSPWRCRARPSFWWRWWRCCARARLSCRSIPRMPARGVPICWSARRRCWCWPGAAFPPRECCPPTTGRQRARPRMARRPKIRPMCSSPPARPGDPRGSACRIGPSSTGCSGCGRNTASARGTGSCKRRLPLSMSRSGNSSCR
ncbi:putative polyketide synthase component [Salipiger abyssi]|uniref:Putative polyketide synthase component n=1 Tax=Salipiger abyssi TaxID=1250539 RepID=A0A1P8UR78_9RHOB|nr:putative polyketide synthase component [Salipiger abyssi]